MSNRWQLLKCSLVGAAIVSLVGCTLRPNLAGAYVKKGGDKTEIVEVILAADDAKAIKDREIYLWIVVVDCNNYDNRYPITPYIAGQPASDFKFPVVGQFVTAQGTIPKRILANFPKPCVGLEGGSYFFGKIESTPVPLVWLVR